MKVHDGPMRKSIEQALFAGAFSAVLFAGAVAVNEGMSEIMTAPDDVSEVVVSSSGEPALPAMVQVVQGHGPTMALCEPIAPCS